MANVLPFETRVRIVSALCEGNSIRATSRMTSVDKNAVMNLALRVGEGCAHLHSKLVRGLSSYVVQCDETWSFIAKKEARCDPSTDPAEWGDVYSFLAIDSSAKIIISFHVGKRDGASTDALIADLRSRLRVVPHITTDGWQPYISAVGSRSRAAQTTARSSRTTGPDRVEARITATSRRAIPSSRRRRSWAIRAKRR